MKIDTRSLFKKFYEKLNDGQSEIRKMEHTTDETLWHKSCLSCKSFYNEVCHEHCFRISYEEAGTKTCPKQLFHASEFLGLED